MKTGNWLKLPTCLPAPVSQPRISQPAPTDNHRPSFSPLQPVHHADADAVLRGQPQVEDKLQRGAAPRRIGPRAEAAAAPAVAVAQRVAAAAHEADDDLFGRSVGWLVEVGVLAQKVPATRPPECLLKHSTIISPLGGRSATRRCPP
jgi:hypothetical protein